MEEAYGFGLPGFQKPLIIENYGVLNTRTVSTRWTATLGTRNVLFVCDYYMWREIGAFSQSFSTELCDADMGLTQTQLQHNTLNNTGKNTKPDENDQYHNTI